ncbi:MAG: hypothetical protein KOO66_05575 [Bacteroidales bacterium]|nr:hypothetical protein [Bacteroidales bacterium]
MMEYKCDEMEELKNNKEEDKTDNKILWEVPKLYSLDKGKTEGGTLMSTYEDADYSDPNS